MPVIQRGTSWQAQVNYKGGRYRRQFDSKREADQWEADSKARLLRGDTPDMGAVARRDTAKPYTLGELMDHVYRTHWAPMRGGDKALINAKSIVNTIGAAMPVAKLGRLQIDNARAKLLEGGNSQATVNRKVAALSKMLGIAEDIEVIERKPKLAKYKESEHRIRRFTPAEETQALTFFERIGNQDMADYVVLSVDTGLRQGEVLGLRYSALVGSRIQVHGTGSKSGRSRTVPLTKRALDVIMRRAQTAEAVADIRDLNGNVGPLPVFPELDRWSVQHYWGRLRNELNLEHDKQFVPHIMRHEFCSRLADRRRSAPEIMALAGHSALSVSQRYIHINGATLDDAIGSLDDDTPALPTPGLTVEQLVAALTKAGIDVQGALKSLVD